MVVEEKSLEHLRDAGTPRSKKRWISCG